MAEAQCWELSINKYPKKAFANVGLVLLFLFISACQANAEGSPLASSPTPIICPDAGTNNINLDAIDLRPKLIVILVGSTPSQSEFSAQALGIIKDTLPLLIDPGDQIAVFRLGYRDYRDAIVLDVNPAQVARQAILPSPSAPATLVPETILTSTSSTQLGQMRERNLATETAFALQSTATVEWANYNCAQLSWKNNFQAAASDWEGTKQAVVTGVANEIDAALAAYAQNNLTQAQTPSANSVYEGLINASVVFDGVGCTDDRKETDIFKRCILIIFDSLHDWRRAQIEAGMIEPDKAWDINLKNIEVLSIMLNCSRVYQPDCAAWQTFWTPQFIDLFGSSSVDYLDNRDIENKLAGFLQR